MVRKQAEPQEIREANDGQRLLADAPERCCLKEQNALRRLASIAKLSGFVGQRAGQKKSLSGWPYEDLSRMKGNFHVRFLGECGRGNPPALTRQTGAGRVASLGLKLSGQCSEP